METTYWIDSAGFSQHYAAAYPTNEIVDQFEISTIRDKKKYQKITEGVDQPSLGWEFYCMRKELHNEVQPLPISIPSYDMRFHNGKQLKSFNIYMAGYKITSRMYGEFKNLQYSLLTDFPQYVKSLPKFPVKFNPDSTTSENEYVRKQLEQYFYDLCRIKVIAESDLVQDFLSDSEDFISDSVVEIRIKLPDNCAVSVTVKKSSKADEVWNVLVQRAGLSLYTQEYFYLFERVQPNFHRKLQPDEFPYLIYTQNYSLSVDTCLCVRRWLFSIYKELSLPNDEQALKFIFIQLINQESEVIGAKDTDLCTGITEKYSSNPSEYLALVRNDPSYAYIEFPHCGSDIYKSVCVIPFVGIMSFRLYPCREDSTYEMDPIDFMWDNIAHWKCDEEATTFSFQISEEQLPGRWIKLYTAHYAFLVDCFNKVMEERNSDAGYHVM